MTKWLTVAAISVAGLALTAVVAAGGMHHVGLSGHGHGHGEGHGEGLDWFVNGALDDLDATEAQRTQVLAVKDRLADADAKAPRRARRACTPLSCASGRRTRWTRRSSISSWTHGSPSCARTLHQMVDGVAEIHDTLTPEQRRRLVEKVQEMHGPR